MMRPYYKPIPIAPLQTDVPVSSRLNDGSVKYAQQPS